MAGGVVVRTMKAHVLIAILSGITVFCVLYVAAWHNLRGMRNVCRRQDETRFMLRSVSAQLEEYQVDNGKFPESLAELEKRQAGLDERGHATDGWGRPLRYRLGEKSYTLYSLGRDGAIGGLGLNADLYHDGRTRDLSLPTFHQYVTTRDTREIDKGRFVFAGTLAGAIVSVVVFRSLRDLCAGTNTLSPVPLFLSVVVVTVLACAVGIFLLPLHVPSGH